MSYGESESFWTRHPVWSLLGVFLAVLLCSAGAWGIKVAISPVKGAGDVVIKNQDANNRIQSQAKMENLYHAVTSADKGLDALAATVRAHPNDRIAQDNYNGSVLICHNAVESYNAEARKITTKDWITADLPEQINDNDPATDCKESSAK